MREKTSKAPARRISAEAAAELVQPGMWLDYGVSTGQPDVFDKALAQRIGQLDDIKLRNCFTLAPRAVLAADPGREHIQCFSWHFSGYDRRMHDQGLCHYIPLNLGEVPDYYRRFIEPVDIVVLKTCPMDSGGWFNFSVSNVWQRTIVERARVVIVETNSALPYVFPAENGLHVGEVDYIIEGDDAPPPEFGNPPPSSLDEAVAHLIAPEVEDGACLQIGIGGMPNAVCELLTESGVKDLGVHTELLTESIVDLYKAGQVTGARKGLDPGKVVFTFALGSRDFYAALDRNPDMLCRPVEYTNMPEMISKNDRVVSINSTTQIDLQGQAASESDGHRHISGTGGQLQFVRGAYASKGGKSFVCLPSTYERKGVRKSRIVLELTAGNIVTTPRSDIMYVVTEYGIANLKGRSVAERARALISLAHPDFREELERQAHEHRLLPRAVPVSAL